MSSLHLYSRTVTTSPLRALIMPMWPTVKISLTPLIFADHCGIKTHQICENDYSNKYYSSTYAEC